MKKLFISFFAVAAVFAGCTKFEEDAPVQLDTTSAPTVQVKVVDDNTISVTVTGADKTGFYSYAVVPGEADVTAGGLLKSPGKVKGALASAVVDFSKTPTTTFKVEELTPNMKYTAYAVAASTRGVVTDVASASATTTDGTVPALKGVKSEATDTTLAITISYDDPVVLGSPSVKATFFAINDLNADKTLKAYKTVSIDKKDLSTDGKTLIVNIPAREAIPGAYVAITYGEGTVKNGVGQLCKAYENKQIGFNEEGKLAQKGLFGRYETKNWDFVLPMIKDAEGKSIRMPADTVLYFSDWTELVMPCVSRSKYPVGPAADPEKFVCKIVSTEPSGRTVSYPAVYKETCLAVNDSTVAFSLGEKMAYGATVTFNIAEGAFEDLFGNPCNAFAPEKDNYFFSYGYKLADIVGTYSISCTSAITGNPLPGCKMVVEESDDAEQGNIMITKFFDVEGKIYLDFNVHAGTVVIPEFGNFVVAPDESSGICFFFNNAGDATATVEPGKIQIPGIVALATWVGSDLTGIVKDADGNKLAATNFVATRD